jgi:beta-lactamase superfamily II metal-dependent hydrolase
MPLDPASVTLLDMGEEKYGDCVLLRLGPKLILIDGGHRGDDQPRNGYPSIPDQLKRLTGRWPLTVDLLVVTHCHADHIGCLPKLVQRGELTARWALVADPDLGWGKVGNLPDTADAATAWDAADPLGLVQTLVTALFDDRPLADLPEGELTARLADAAGMATAYTDMIARLQQDGAKVVRYGVDSHTALVKAFADCGLRILGPTKKHLLTCARLLAKIGRDAAAETAALAAQDAAADAVSLLRSLAGHPGFAADLAGAGAALNNQSIVLRVEINGRRLLLTGDMQLALPEVPGLDASMTALRGAVRKAGPYFFAKTPHHSATNGVAPDVLADWGPATLLAHSGGLKDGGHPSASALDALRALARKGAFARTDRNGQITLDLAAAQPRFAISRGALDDFRVNPKPVRPPDLEPLPGPLPPAHPPIAWERHERGDFVEIVARLPREPVRVTLTVEVEAAGAVAIRHGEGGAREIPDGPDTIPAFKLGGGRTFPKLLFVTSAAALTANIGGAAVRAALAAIRAAGGAVLDDLPAGIGVQEAAIRTQAALLRGDYQGVVLLGGYDVVPSARLDTLTPELRRHTEEADFQDADDFIVWSDAVYADSDRDSFAELPISRVPDGKSRELFLAALQADAGPSPPRKFAVLNAQRPFAQAVFKAVPGAGPALISAPATAHDTAAAQADAQGQIYFMLHGSDADGSALWGDDPATGRQLEAVDVPALPAHLRGVVFTGACWGALIVTRRAAAQSLGRPPQGKSPDLSLALSALRRGCQAFVGCTGSHYSPLGRKADAAGAPLHVAFWKHLRAGQPPAAALFLAKRDYAARIPYRPDPLEEAVDQKILRQFTCLGLGW